MSVAGFTDNVEGAAVTFSVTGNIKGCAAPVTVTVMEDTYWPTGRLVGFTLTLRVAGRLPLSRLTVNQKSVAGVDVVNDGVPALARTDIFWDFGNAVAPDW